MQNTLEQNKSVNPHANGLSQAGATVVISHQVTQDKHSEYEAWLNEIGPLCKTSKGLLDYHIIRPIDGLTNTYSIIIRYDTEQNLKQWMESSDRKGLINKIEGVLTGSDTYQIKSGLDFWFMPEGGKAKIPVRWKQLIITWSAIYPLVLGMPIIILPLLRWAHVPANHLVDVLFITLTIVFMMVYVIMPRYTKWARDWLFK